MNFKSIPDIFQYKEIIEAAKRGRLILFIGAGVSKLVGCPSWSELASAVLDHARKNGCIDFRQKHYLISNHAHDPRKLLSICINMFEQEKIAKPNFESLLKPKNNDKDPMDIYQPLYSTKSIFLTTNYDPFLYHAAKIIHADKADSKLFYLEKDLLISKLQAENIIHIHGSYEKQDELVLSLSDYFKRYREKSNLRELLQHIFDMYTVLFIGYGLEEYEILEFMVNISQRESGRNRLEKHYMLFPSFNEDNKIVDLFELYYKDIGIKLIPYPRNENDYQQLEYIIKDWCKEIKSASRPANIADKMQIIDKVLENGE